MVSYKEMLLERGHVFSVRLDKGWIFAKVKDFEDVPVKYNRIDPMAAGATTFSINGGTAAGFNPLTNSDNNELLYDFDPDVFLQVFFGIAPDTDCRVFRRIPSPTPRGNLSRTKVTALGPNAIGYLDGIMTPYDDPEDCSMMILPPKINVDFGIYNRGAGLIVPQLNFWIRRIAPNIIDIDNSVGKALVEAIFEGRKACTRYSPGLGESGLKAFGGKMENAECVAEWGVM